jgi:DNA-binding SARP family transcriptional activator/WD40 repeat protein
VVAIGVLGPLEVDGGVPLSPRDRVVVESLVVHGGRAVPADRLADALWGDNPPASWAKVVQGSIMRLRRVLGPGVIETTSDGYRLAVDGDAIDARAFEQLVGRARSLADVGDHERAASTLERALALWRGRPFADLDAWAPAQAEAARLDALRHGAQEALLDARLASGDLAGAVADGEALVTAEPLSERRWALLALALYRSGRQGDALRAIQRARRVLGDELGVTPGPELTELEQRLLQQDPGLAGTPAVPPAAAARCPYRGLIPYDVDDNETFFGRDREVDACLHRLAAAPFLAVVGASGSGKSSLVRAGVANRLRRSGRNVAVFTPGADPQGSLATTLATATSSTVLVVDQLEELVTMAMRPEVVHALLDALVERVSIAPVVVALRADQVGTIGMHAAFARRLESGLHLVTPMTDDELREVIEEPARVAGLRLEPGLVELLLRDVAGEPGGLPLLSFALAATWANREGRVLTVEGYQAAGGLRRAVATAADRLYDSLPPDQRPFARSLFLRLVTPIGDGEVVRHRLDPSVITAGETDRRVVDAFVRTRLLVMGDAGLEVAHEALVREWPRLRSWLEEDQDGQRIFRHLTAASAGWDAMGRPESELYRGSRLQAALEWQSRTAPHLTETERAFLDASAAREQDEARALQKQLRQQSRQNRRLRGLLVAAAIAVVIALTAGVVALAQRNRADHSASRADQQRNSAVVARLVAESGRELDSHLDLGMLLAVEAHRHTDTPETRGALLDAVAHNVSSERRTGLPFRPQLAGNPHHTNSSFIGFLHGPNRPTDAVALSGNGRIVADAGPLGQSSTAGGLVQIHDTTTRTEIGRITTASVITAVDVSPDGREVIASDGLSLYAFDVPTRQIGKRDLHVMTEGAGPNPADTVAFQPGGRKVLATVQTIPDSRWTVLVYAAALTPVDAVYPTPASGKAAFFAPDGTMALVGDDSILRFVNVDTGGVSRSVALDRPGDWSSASSFTISPNGSQLAADVDGLAYVWNLRTGRLVGDARRRPPSVSSLAFSPTSPTILTIASGTGPVSFYDLTTESVIGNPLRGRAGGAGPLAYSSDGRYLATSAADGQIELWTDNGANGLVLHPTGANRWTNDIASDGTRLIVWTSRGAEIRDARRPEGSGVPLQLPTGVKVSNAGPTNFVARFSTDGSVIAVLCQRAVGRQRSSRGHFRCRRTHWSSSLAAGPGPGVLSRRLGRKLGRALPGCRLPKCNRCVRPKCGATTAVGHSREPHRRGRRPGRHRAGQQGTFQHTCVQRRRSLHRLRDGDLWEVRDRPAPCP